jgi:uncharacterized protein
MKYVLFYQSSPDVATLAPLHGAAHRAWWKEYLSNGTLLMVGPFANPQEGAMGIFTTREAAEEFARNDPFRAQWCRRSLDRSGVEGSGRSGVDQRRAIRARTTSE